MENNNKKILIVEDDEDFLFILEKVFKAAGFMVVTAKDGEAGINAAVKEKPNLILSDVLMPRMDGPTMAAKIKETNKTTPIVFLTNVSGEIKNTDGAPFKYLMKSELHLNEIVEAVKIKLNIA
jgi:two-component system alkaline phosphatase synthesis response regulator PhoP